MPLPPTIYIAAIFGGTAVLITAMNLISRLTQRRASSLATSSEVIAHRLERLRICRT